MAFEWFRSWHGAPTDSKYRVVAKRAGVAPGMVSAVYWALLDYASQNEPRGSVEGFDTETYAEWAGWEEGDIQAIIEAFTIKQTIIDGQIVASCYYSTTFLVSCQVSVCRAARPPEPLRQQEHAAQAHRAGRVAIWFEAAPLPGNLTILSVCPLLS